MVRRPHSTARQTAQHLAWGVGVCLVILAAGGLAGCADEAGPDPSGGPYALVDAFPNLTFDRPLCLVHAGDGSGRLFVVEQAGRIHVFPAQPNVAAASVFLDIGPLVRREHNEEGLLALAFHPSYATNGFFYVYYSASSPLRNVLARYKVDPAEPNRGDPSSARVLLEIPKPYGNHNGATLLFGTDGYLYVSIGDGGGAGDPQGNGQSLQTLLGKILRLDVDHEAGSLRYAIPADNPFASQAGARGEIWAYGLRNVWRMSFDRDTHELWAGDVGQNRWEEIDIITRGGNYGWSYREGTHAFRPGQPAVPAIEPVIDYGRSEGASVTGGYVYRGAHLAALAGSYIYGDYVSGTVWALRTSGGHVVSNTILMKQPKNIASFGEAPDGELYVLAFDGKIYRIEAQ